MRRVCLLGGATDRLEPADFLRDLDGVEIWAANEMANRLPEPLKASRVFQLHPRDWREEERRFLYHGELPDGCDPDCFGRNSAHVEYLRTSRAPVYVQQVWEDIPNGFVYPFGTVCEAVGIALPPAGNKRLWATSTFGYMLALLLTGHINAQGTAPFTVSEILLYGVELPTGTQRERLWEWPNLAYYLGLAAGLGIKITLPGVGSSLLSAPHYALGGHPWAQEADHWWVPGYGGIVYDDEDGVYRLGTWEEPR